VYRRIGSSVPELYKRRSLQILPNEPRCLQANTELVIVLTHKLLMKMLLRDDAIAFTVKLVHALKLAWRRDILPIR
jgi:hypothetical protein